MAQFVLRVLFFYLALVAAAEVQCRVLSLRPDESPTLISDGVDDDFDKIRYNLLDVKYRDLSYKTCEHIYGFLPCADNLGGYIFQVVVFECLLLAGDYLLSKASTRLFDVFGVGIFGAIVFRLLIMLPRIALILASGLSASHEAAQSMAVTGVGLTAGYTVFSLTLQWGACIIFGRTDIPNKNTEKGEASSLTHSTCKKLSSSLTRSGVQVDQKTKHGAGIMLLSLIPFVMVQLSEILESSSWKRDVVLVTLIVSILALILYFVYQFLDPSDQKRSLEYFKFRHLLTHFLTQIEKNARDKLVINDGDPDSQVISRVLHMIDKEEGDAQVSKTEVENLVLSINSQRLHQEKAYALEEFFKIFDSDSDRKVSKIEFVNGCERLLNRARQLARSDQSSSTASLSEYKEGVHKWIADRGDNIEQIPQLMSGVLKHVNSLLHQSILGHGEQEDKECIESLFKNLDENNDGVVKLDELDNITTDFEFGSLQHKMDEVVNRVIEELNESPSESTPVDKQELSEGITTLLKEASRFTADSCEAPKLINDEHHCMMQEKSEDLMMNKKDYERLIDKLFSGNTLKAALQVIIGALIVIFLGRPLMMNIQLLSESIGIPSFFTSFVVTPLAINIRQALSARFPARQKMERTASLTFSEIYGGVVMNNILSLSIILAIIYTRDLKWDYSTEVLIVSAVGLVIGLLAFLRSTYPFWACILAFSMYPMSLMLVYVLHYVSNWD